MFPCNVKKQVACSHAMIQINNNIDEETTVTFDEKYYVLKVKEQKHEAMKAGSKQIVSQLQHQCDNVSNMGIQRIEEHKQLSNDYQVKYEEVSTKDVPAEYILLHHLPRPPEEILPQHLPRLPEEILPYYLPRPPEILPHYQPKSSEIHSQELP